MDLASEKEIDSTERLLNLIRNESQTSADPAQRETTVSAPAPKKRAIKRALPAGKKYTVGVDIGHTYVKLAKVAHGGDKQFELVDYLTVNPGWSFTLNDRKFQDLLETTLDQFCADGHRYEVWSAIPSAKVEIRHLRIPKLPRKQVANAVFWTFTKMVEFNETQEILDFEILGDVVEQGVKKTEVVAFKVPREEIGTLKQIYEKIGYPLKGITIVPFGVQNLFRTGIVTHPEEEVCSLFVGRDWSRIAIYSDGLLMLARGVRAGMQSMVEAIAREMFSITLEKPADGEPGNAQNPPAFVHPQAQRIFLNFLKVQAVADRPDPSDDAPVPDDRQVFQMMLPAMERLVRQIERTFEHYSQTFHREGVRRILLSGRVIGNPLIAAHISHQLDLPVQPLDPFATGSGFATNVKSPETAEERESYAPAIGIAVSNNALTPNMLYTHSDREQFESTRRFNSRVLVLCMLCLLALIGYFSWQGRKLDNRRLEAHKLAQQLAVYQPPAEKELILAMFAKIREKAQAVTNVSDRYAPAAIVGELAQLTPAAVRLLDLQISQAQSPQKGKNPVASRTISLEGLVFGASEGFDVVLTNYLLTLQNSPIFHKPELQEQQIQFYNNQEVLHFKARLEML